MYLVIMIKFSNLANVFRIVLEYLTKHTKNIHMYSYFDKYNKMYFDC